jgi:YD repeat-containing protein
MNQTAIDVLLARFSQLIRGCCVWLSLLLCVAALFGAGSAWSADPLGPGWFNAQGTPVTPAEARVLRESAARPRAAFRAMAAGAYQTDAATITPEITALARGLLNNPLLMYEYVHNNINYVPYYGSLKGATLTYLDGAGNDFDQASLLIALLRAAGFTADYVYGTMSIPAYGAAGNKDMAHWLGVDPDITVISTVLTNAGIPYAEGATYLVDRVWVQATVSGSTYLLDPAFKVYQTTQGIDLVTAMGYNRANVLSAAGGTTGTSSIVNLNEANLRTLLNTYTTNLLTNLRANYPNAHTEDITGGKTIVPVFSSSLPPSLDFAASPQYTWTSIPQDYAHTVQIKHGQIDETFNIASLSGQKLAIVYAAGGSPSMSSAGRTSSGVSMDQTRSASRMNAAAFQHQTTSRPTVTDVGRTAPPVNARTARGISVMEVPTYPNGSIDFGKVYPDGYTTTDPLTLAPGSGVTVTVSVWIQDDATGAFSLVSGGGTYEITGSLSGVVVRMTGSGQSPGAKSGNLYVAVYYSGQLLGYLVTSLTGTVGVAPDLADSYGYNFGSANLTYPVDGVVRIKNSGSLNLAITGVSLTDGSHFSITGGSQTGTLSPGSYRDINVRYLADSVGSHSSNVQVAFTYDDLPYNGPLPLLGQTIAAPVAQLWLDDQMIVEETEPITGVDLQKLTVSVTHPYLTTFADQSVDYTLSRDPSHAYAIVYDFGASRLGRLVEKRERQLQAYRDSGLADTSRQVLTESLNVIGMTWMRDTSLNEDLVGRRAGVVDLRQHRFGIVAQEEGYYIDVKVQASSLSSMSAASDNSEAYFKAKGHLDSAMEHGVLEQMQINRPAVSTVKLFEINNTDGNRFFIADSSNFSTIRPELVAANYSTADLDALQASVNSGNTLILPANGQITVQSWSGRGYIEYRHGVDASYIGMIIGRGYYGGYGVINSPLSISDVNYQVGLNILPQITTYKIPALEPVDMATGYFLYDNTDLSLSGGSPGLALKRAYNSGNNNTQSAVGNGWSHNYNVYVDVASSTPFGMGMRQPQDAAPMMVAAIATLDIMAGTTDIKSWVTGTLIAKWSMDNLTNNGANVHLGGDLLTFIKMPDGSFVSPPGLTSQLVSNGGLYQINERFGYTTSFNSDSKADSITDADGNQVNFTYSSGKLQGVADSFGHSLAFTYTGDLLTQVSDSAGRNIYYGYDGNNLTSYTDAEGKVWRYGYDTNHRILTLTNPLDITTATNTYDSFGRVMTQTVPRQTGTAVHNLYFSGYRNAEDDAAGNLMVYYFDDHKNLIGQEDPLGHVTEKVYDGQKHVVSVIDPRNNTTSFQYDGNNNLVLTTDAYGKQTQNTYDTSFHLTDVTDPLGHVTHQDFNSTHHPTNTITYPAQGRSITTTKGYYANGLLHTATDGRSITTTLAYDARGNPATSMTSTYPAISYTYDGVGRMTALTDRLSATTNFVYDRRSLLTSRTDPLTRPTAMTYYDDGTLHTVTDRNNATVTYSYTPTSKPNTVTYPGGSTVGFTYNTQDNLVQMQDSLGTTTYGYDAASRLITHTDANGFALTYGTTRRTTSRASRIREQDRDLRL